jgi:hypothetical protein
MFTYFTKISRLPLMLIGIALVCLASSCSPYALVNSETYNNANLAAYHTFRIVTPDQEIKLPPGMEMVTYYNIAAAIREQMLERGFTEDAASPLLINIGLTVKKEIQTEPAIPPGYIAPPPPRYFGPYYRGMGPWLMYPRTNYWAGYYSNARVITGIYKEGVLTMDIINIQEKLPLYSASVATILQNGQAQFRNLQGITEAVQTLFSKFPVPLLPQYREK